VEAGMVRAKIKASNDKGRAVSIESLNPQGGHEEGGAEEE